MTILTASNSAFAEAASLCISAAGRYCSTRNIRLVREFIPDSYSRQPSWAKVQFIKRHLQFNDYVLWVDADAMIVGNHDLHALLAPATLNIAKDANGINCGVMAWRCCPQAFEALHRMDAAYERFRDDVWFEQKALMEFVDELDVHYQPKHIFNAYEDDACADTFIRHWPGMSMEERLPLMRAAANK